MTRACVVVASAVFALYVVGLVVPDEEEEEGARGRRRRRARARLER